MDYQQDIFYLSAHRLSPTIQEEICRDAYSKCDHWWIDDMPSWTRRKIDMSLDEILPYLYTYKIHFCIIHRRGYQNCLEIGFSTMNKQDENGDLFLWIHLDESHIPYFVKKYKLTLK